MAQTYDQLQDYPCTQCGQPISGQTLAKRQARNPEGYSTRCADCAAVPVATIRATGCQPWDGDFDWDLMTPTLNGQPVMPGLRECGHADCMNKKHVLPMSVDSVALIGQQFSVPNRSGVRRSYAGLVADLKKQKGLVNG